VKKLIKTNQKIINLESNKLFIALMEDTRPIIAEIGEDPYAIETPKGVILYEDQYYIQQVGFYLVHTINLCQQLNLAIEFLSNFDYSKKNNASRADHLIYNVENYFIRLNSVKDRVLQLVNAVFHLCISEEHVNYSIITSNQKVKHRKLINSKIKAIKKFLEKYAQARHTIIHKHSYQESGLRKIELFYLTGIDEDMGENFKTFRSNHLRNYITKQKQNFTQINEKLFMLLDELFEALSKEYERQKENLK